MATTSFLGRAKATAQVSTHTVGGTAAISQVYSITINGKTVSYTASGVDTNTTIATALTALLNASTITEFSEYTWTSNAAVITSTADATDEDGTITSAATGTGTLVTAVTTAATGPTNWNDANNWSGAAVPGNGDDVLVMIPCTIKNGLDQSAVTLASLKIGSDQVRIGRKRINAAGYTEFRELYLKIGATICIVGLGEGRGTDLTRINFGSVQTGLEIRNTSSSIETGWPAVEVLGTHASNTLDLQAGFAGVAVAGVASTILTATSAERGNLVIGSGVTLGTVRGSGIVQVNAAVTTMTQGGGQWMINGTGAVTTLTQTGGILQYNSSGTLTTATIGGTIIASQDATTRTFTTTTLEPGGAIIDPLNTITYTNGVAKSARVKEIRSA